MTVEEAQADVFSTFHTKGKPCHCCGQLVKAYKRPIYGSMAYGLIRAEQYTRADPYGWFHAPSFFNQLKDTDPKVAAVIASSFSKLRYFGLVETNNSAPQQRPGDPHDGQYHLTPLGRSFVYGQAQTWKYAYLYNWQLLGVSDGVYASAAYVTIWEALQKKFNYEDLMRGTT